MASLLAKYPQIDGIISDYPDVLRRVAAQVAKAKPGEWIRGRGWDEGKLAERRYITAR